MIKFSARLWDFLLNLNCFLKEVVCFFSLDIAFIDLKALTITATRYMSTGHSILQVSYYLYAPLIKCLDVLYLHKFPFPITFILVDVLVLRI